MNKVYYGENKNHDFWQSEDCDLLILRRLNTTGWIVFKNYLIIDFCDTLEEALTKHKAEKDTTRTWAKQELIRVK